MLMVRGAPAQQADRCATCQGRGWLYVRTRSVYRSDAPNLLSTSPHEPCWDWGGVGRTTRTASSREPGSWLEAASGQNQQPVTEAMKAANELAIFAVRHSRQQPSDVGATKDDERGRSRR